jgi:NADH:ubiquinone oxidoreductase subunit 6 (subunit J)
MIGAYYVLGLVGLTSALAIVVALGHPVHRIAFLVVVFLACSLEYIIVDYTFLGLT